VFSEEEGRRNRSEWVARLYAYELFPAMVLGGAALRSSRLTGGLLRKYIFPTTPDADNFCYCSLKEFLVTGPDVVVCPMSPACDNVSLSTATGNRDTLQARLQKALATTSARIKARLDKKAALTASRNTEATALAKLTVWREELPQSLHQSSAGDAHLTGTSDNFTAAVCTRHMIDDSNFVDMGCDTLMFVEACRVLAHARGVRRVSFYGLEVRSVMPSVVELLNHSATRKLWDSVISVQDKVADPPGVIECRRGDVLDATKLSHIGVCSKRPTTLYAYNIGYYTPTTIYNELYTYIYININISIYTYIDIYIYIYIY
jgi:hypothetical protein